MRWYHRQPLLRMLGKAKKKSKSLLARELLLRGASWFCLGTSSPSIPRALANAKAWVILLEDSAREKANQTQVLGWRQGHREIPQGLVSPIPNLPPAALRNAGARSELNASRACAGNADRDDGTNHPHPAFWWNHIWDLTPCQRWHSCTAISASHKGWGGPGSPCQHSPRGPARCPSQASDRFQPSHLQRTSPKNAIGIHAIPPQNPEGVSALVISIFLLVCSQKQSKCKNNQKQRSGRATKSLEKGQTPQGSPRDVIPEEWEPHGGSCPAPA